MEAGFYSQTIPDENLVHNLEHGYVVISYNCGRLLESDCQSLQDNVRNVVESNGEKLIGVARPTLNTPVALTAWGRILKLESFDEAQILEFIKNFRYKAPEGSAP